MRAAVRRLSNRHIIIYGLMGTSFNHLTHEEVLQQLKSGGLRSGQDFDLRRISAGYALAKDAELVVFEMMRTQCGSIDWLDCDLDFRGTGGARYRKEIFCIPRDKNMRWPDADKSALPMGGA